MDWGRDREREREKEKERERESETERERDRKKIKEKVWENEGKRARETGANEREMGRERKRVSEREGMWERVIEGRSDFGISKYFSDRRFQNFNNLACFKCAQNFGKPKQEKIIESRNEKILKKKLLNEEKRGSEEREDENEEKRDKMGKDKDGEEDGEKIFRTKFGTCFKIKFRPQRVEKPRPVFFNFESVSSNGNSGNSGFCKNSDLESVLVRLDTNGKKIPNEFESDLVTSMRNIIVKQELPERFSRAWKRQERKTTKTPNSSLSSSFSSVVDLENPKSEKKNGEENGSLKEVSGSLKEENGSLNEKNGRLRDPKFVSDSVSHFSRGEDFNFDIHEVKEILSSLLRKNKFVKDSIVNPAAENVVFPEIPENVISPKNSENVVFPEKVIWRDNPKMGRNEKGGKEQKEKVIGSLTNFENCKNNGEVKKVEIGEGERFSEISGVNRVLTENDGIFQEGNLTAVKKLREISRSKRGNRLKLGELGATNVLISIIESSYTGKNVLSTAITALLNLSLEVELKDDIVKVGILQPLFRILKTAQEALAKKNVVKNVAKNGGKNGECNGETNGEKKGDASNVFNSVIEGGIGIVRSLSATRGNQKIIRELGFMVLLIQFLGKEEMSVRAHHDVTMCLVNLGLDEIGKEELVNLGCVDVLLEILQNGLLNGRFTEDTVFLLSELVPLSQARIRFELLYGVELIGSVLYHGSVRSKNFTVKILFFVASGSMEGIRKILAENLLVSVYLVANHVDLPFRSMVLSLLELLRKEETTRNQNS